MMEEEENTQKNHKIFSRAFQSFQFNLFYGNSIVCHCQILLVLIFSSKSSENHNSIYLSLIQNELLKNCLNLGFFVNGGFIGRIKKRKNEELRKKDTNRQIFVKYGDPS
jgi:hypothetical protein